PWSEGSGGPPRGRCLSPEEDRLISRQTSVRSSSAEEAGNLIREQLVGTAKCDQVATDCALLRSCVWALTGGERPVHVLKLLNLAVDASPDSVLAGDEMGS